jgi:selenocysteine lyase/cysteine desulfurase
MRDDGPGGRPGEDAASGVLGRRALLGAGAAVGIGLLSACTSDGDDKDVAATSAQTSDAGPDPQTSVAPELDPQDWGSVRAQFQLDPALAHFAAFVFASHPAPVASAVEQHRAALDHDPEGYVDKGLQFENAVRVALARRLDVDAKDIALTDSTTMGLGLLYGGIRLEPGDEILTTTHDFYSTNESLSLAAKRTGAEVKQVTLYDTPAQADAEQIVERLRGGITPRTRVVAVTWVHSGTGVRIPVGQIATAVAAVNDGRAPGERALLCVDGVHGFGLMDESIPDLGCDFFSAGTHKWLMGPRGTGVLWGRAWDRVATTIPTFSAPHFAPGPHATPGGYHSFEHRWAVPEAVGFHDAIGPDRVQDYTLQQASQLKEGLAGITGVTLVTPTSPDLSAGIVCLQIDAVDPWDAVPRLRADHGVVASVTPYNEPYLRLGPSIVTSPAEVDTAVKAISALAG